MRQEDCQDSKQRILPHFAIITVPTYLGKADLLFDQLKFSSFVRSKLSSLVEFKPIKQLFSYPPS